MSQRDLIVQDVDQIVPVDTKVLYWLYGIECIIMFSMLYARMVQYRSMNRGADMVAKGEKESEECVKKSVQHRASLLQAQGVIPMDDENIADVAKRVPSIVIGHEEELSSDGSGSHQSFENTSNEDEEEKKDGTTELFNS